MGIGSLFPSKSTGYPEGSTEYGRDGDWWRSMYTPWPGVVNDAMTAPYVTRQQAEGLPGIGRGAELITGVVAQLRLSLYQDHNHPNRISRQLDPTPLLQNPDPLWHGLPEWLSAVVGDLIWYGDSFAYRGPEVCDYRGYPIRLPLFRGDAMAWDGSQYIYTANSTPVELARGDVAHFLVSAQAGHQFGTGVLDRYQLELKIMLATEKAQFVLMKDGKPMGILSLGVDVTPEQATQYKQGFLAAVKESGVAAIGNADFKPVQWSSADLSMVPTREFNLRLASDIIGVPPYLLGVPSESRVYANMETEWSTFLKVTMGRYLKSLESVLSSCFPRGQSVVIDTEELLRSDSKTRMEIYSIGISSGVMTVDEARHMENRPPLPKQPEPVPHPAPDEDEPADDEEASDDAA